jgi:hypothetical protein
MKHLPIIGTAIVLVGGLALLVSTDTESKESEGPTGLPNTNRVTHVAGPQGGVQAFVDGESVPRIVGGKYDVHQARIYRDTVNAIFAIRRKTLPNDANLGQVDQYSKGLFGFPYWALPAVQLSHDTIATSNMVLVDEYGRVYPKHYGFGGDSPLDLFTNLLSNPLMQAVISIAVTAFGGPAGVAVLGAYTLWNARGQELTLQNIAMSSVRTALVAECGPACGMAFDMGVGIMRGKSVDEAAEDALLEQLTPEQKAAYDQGKEAYSDVS